MKMYKIYYTSLYGNGVRKFICSCEDENEMVQAIERILSGGAGVVEIFKSGQVIMYAA